MKNEFLAGKFSRLADPLVQGTINAIKNGKLVKIGSSSAITSASLIFEEKGSNNRLSIWFKEIDGEWDVSLFIYNDKAPLTETAQLHLLKFFHDTYGITIVKDAIEKDAFIKRLMAEKSS